MTENSQVTLKSLADQVGISASTVSRILSGKAKQYRISEKTEMSVRKAAERFGFQPNQIASSLRLKKTNTFGLIIPDISNTFFANVAHHIEIAARKINNSIILCDSQENEQNEIESIRLLQSRNVDGLIISPVGQIGDMLLNIRRQGTPVVLLDRYFPGVDLPYVTSRNYEGAFEATEHLLLQGHRKIACIKGLPEASTCIDRLAGFRDAFKKHGVEIDESLIVGDAFSEMNGYVETRRLMKRQVRPTAIFSLGNPATFGAMRALAEANLSIPKDISLVTFDDHYYSAFLAAPLTAVAQDMQAFGQIAVKLLCDQMECPGGVREDGISLPTQLIVRESVRKVN